MTSIHQNHADPQALRSLLRSDLVAAMKARQPDVVTALRTALAALDNAEAVNVPESAPGLASDVIAGAQPGVGSTEVERRQLSIGEIRTILAEQVSERLAAADGYDAHAQHDAAAKLRREAEALGKYLAPS